MAVLADPTGAAADRRAAPGRRRSDRRPRTFAPPVVIVRWVALVIGIALASPDIVALDWTVIGPGLALAAYTVGRTLHPLTGPLGPRARALLVLEVALHVAAVGVSGWWESPWVFCMVAAVMVGGFAGGFVPALGLAGLATAGVAGPALVVADDVGEALRLSAQWGGELLLVALVAGYARRLSWESEEQHTLALDRLGRLAEANALLYSLHRVAQTLPASLDLDEVLDSSMLRLRDLVRWDSAAILLLEETDGAWVPVRREGVKVDGRLATEELPEPLRDAAAGTAGVLQPDLLRAGLGGLSASAACGVYAPLSARGVRIGLLVLEAGQPRALTTRDLEVVNGFVEPLALAVDNARWFARLRTVGADEERTRIARDLHDQIGQSLAYLAFEVDRVIRVAERGGDVARPLDGLRKDLRHVIREVRDTLYDLRTDVSEAESFTATLDGFLERVRDRSGLEVVTRMHEDRRLPLPQERELWWIAKEAVTNVERHAQATRISVSWRCDEQGAELVVADDGVGLGQGAQRPDAYGLVGMRERAASIGARLDVDSPGHGGTVVRALLEAEPTRG